MLSKAFFCVCMCGKKFKCDVFLIKTVSGKTGKLPCVALVLVSGNITCLSIHMLSCVHIFCRKNFSSITFHRFVFRWYSLIFQMKTKVLMFSQYVYSASWSDSDFIPEGKQNRESTVAFALGRFVKLLVLLPLSHCGFLNVTVNICHTRTYLPVNTAQGERKLISIFDLLSMFKFFPTGFC